MIVSASGLPRCQGSKRVHFASLWAGCLLPLQCFPSFPSSYVTIHLPFPKTHSSFGLENEAHRLCLNHFNGGPARPLHRHPDPGRVSSFGLSSCSTPQNRGDFWTPGATRTNQAVRGFHTALITAVCRNAKDRVNRSDLAGNHRMLFKVNVLWFIKNFLLGHLSEKRRKAMIFLLPSSPKVKARMSPKNITLISNFKNLTSCHQVQSPSEIH